MRATSILLTATFALTACQQPRQLYVDQGYVRLPAVKGNPGVAYFTIHGGQRPQTLISVTSPSVIKSELHESMTTGGRASMKRIGDVAVGPAAALPFAPGGRHVMLFDINKKVQPGSYMPLIFTFANNVRVQYDAPVIAAGDAPPKG